MIVVTLTAKAIVQGATMYVTECGMAKLKNGDRLHCLPDLGQDLLKKYPENFTASPWWDFGDVNLIGGRYEVQPVGMPDRAKTAAPAAPTVVTIAETPKRSRTRVRSETTAEG